MLETHLMVKTMSEEIQNEVKDIAKSLHYSSLKQMLLTICGQLSSNYV